MPYRFRGSEASLIDMTTNLGKGRLSSARRAAKGKRLSGGDVDRDGLEHGVEGSCRVGEAHLSPDRVRRSVSEHNTMQERMEW